MFCIPYLYTLPLPCSRMFVHYYQLFHLISHKSYMHIGCVRWHWVALLTLSIFLAVFF